MYESPYSARSGSSFTRASKHSSPSKMPWRTVMLYALEFILFLLPQILFEGCLMGVNGSDDLGDIGCFNLRVSAVAAVETATLKIRDAVMEIELMPSTLAVASLEAYQLKQRGHFCTSEAPL